MDSESYSILYQREYRRKKKDCPLYKEKCKSHAKKYYEANKVEVSEYISEWRDMNPDKVKKYNSYNRFTGPSKRARRRTALLNATPKWLTIEDHRLISNFYIEAKRLEDTTGIKYHVDHILPLRGKTVWGLHVPWNLQIIEAKENLIKSNKVVINNFT